MDTTETGTTTETTTTPKTKMSGHWYAVYTDKGTMHTLESDTKTELTKALKTLNETSELYAIFRGRKFAHKRSFNIN